MKSIRTKITLLTVCAIIAAIGLATLFSLIAIHDIGNSSSDQILLLMCETGEKELDSYFESVEQSVEIVSTFVKEDLQSVESDLLKSHVERVSAIFENTAYNTNGVLTYYYRIDPAVSDSVKGFWYINMDGNGFSEHEVTDITQYDTEDTTKLVWFTVPKTTGKSLWLSPYVTENLDVRVISYNVPIFFGDLFVGVIGIEIDYQTLVDQVDRIRLYENGYAFISDADGTIVYHPRLDILEHNGVNGKGLSEILNGEDTYFNYSFEGIKKQAVWMPLSNGMRLNVTVPVSELHENLHRLIIEILIISVVILAVFIVLTLRLTGHITQPLRKLTEIAEKMNAGKFDFDLDYSESDEIGSLVKTVERLVNYLKVYIKDLNSLAYIDALTSVKNKGAFDVSIRELEDTLKKTEVKSEFAIGVFDCNNLKKINDEFGHDKGDVYLKTASALICRVFQHSPVFRTGGDEFAVILKNEDYQNRNDLIHTFENKISELSSNPDQWEKVLVAIGVAVYDPEIDSSVEDVVRRADKLMYENKSLIKKKNNENV